MCTCVAFMYILKVYLSVYVYTYIYVYTVINIYIYVYICTHAYSTVSSVLLQIEMLGQYPVQIKTQNFSQAV